MGDDAEQEPRSGGERRGTLEQELCELRRALEREIVEASEKEKRRLGRDIHDDLCQRLGGIRFLVRSLEQRLRSDGVPAAADAAAIVELIDGALASARDLARGLNPVRLEAGGLGEALEALAVGVRSLFGVDVVLDIDPQLYAGDADQASHLFRILQEALYNAARHSGVARIDVVLSRAGKQVELRVIDAGRGFVPNGLARDGMGLSIMRYRANDMDGELEIRTLPGRGTEVVCRYTPRKGQLRRGPSALGSAVGVEPSASAAGGAPSAREQLPHGGVTPRRKQDA